MKKPIAAFALAMLLPVSGAAVAAVVTVSGHGQSYDYGTAVTNARADAVSQCVAQGGTPLEEVYTHVTRANQWLATVIMECEVP